MGAIGVLAVACIDTSESEAAGVARQPIVYGTDDRVEAPYGDVPASIVALIPHATLTALADGGVQPSFEQTHQTCPGERFAEQPAIANCSGVLIAPDLLVTAAHCLELVPSCSDYAYVRNYALQVDGGLPMLGHLDQVGCDSVIVQTHTSIIDDRYLDFAVIRLDRAISPFEPSALRTARPRTGEAVTAIGANGGLPFKAARGTVRDVRAADDYFEYNADIFVGGSGSGVFDDGGALLGIEVRGGVDFELTAEGCYRSRIVPEDHADIEQANTLSSILDGLCAVAPELDACEPRLTSEPIDPSPELLAVHRPVKRPRSWTEVSPSEVVPTPRPPNDAPPFAVEPGKSVPDAIAVKTGCSLAEPAPRTSAPATVLLLLLLSWCGRRWYPDRGPPLGDA
jgi:hypothetical protein